MKPKSVCVTDSTHEAERIVIYGLFICCTVALKLSGAKKGQTKGLLRSTSLELSGKMEHGITAIWQFPPRQSAFEL